MYDPEHMGFSTNQIHAARPEPFGPAPLQTPIYQTSTYIFESTEQGAARFALEEPGYIYTRLHNPTADEVAARIACLEGGEAGMLTASGMGAILAVFWNYLKAGDHILSDSTLYGCTYAFFTEGISRFGVEVSMVDFNDLDAVRAAIRPNTRFAYCETATNPDLKIVDLAPLCAAIKAVNPDILVMVDNTFTSPYLVQPLRLGADIVVHSVTKSLIGRGLKTLDIRMDRHCANAMKVARFLEKHPAVRRVCYPGLESHPQHEVAAREFLHGGFGGMISFELKCGRQRTSELVNRLQLCTLAVSLGDAITLIEHPASMTHNTYTVEALEALGIPESLMRLSVGLEDPDDIIADLKRELDRIEVEA